MTATKWLENYMIIFAQVYNYSDKQRRLQDDSNTDLRVYFFETTQFQREKDLTFQKLKI